MYKVFVNEKVICFTNNAEIVKEFSDVLVLHFYQTEITPILLELLANNKKTKSIIVCVEDYKKSFNDFKTHFKLIKAAGGVVRNKKNELLFIYRLGKWDLPKGKLELNESIEEAAVREVEEECGLNSLTILDSLPDTYHVYENNGLTILKQTFWFSMSTNFVAELTPQLEEGITKVEWLAISEVKEKVFPNTYSSIKSLLKSII